MKVYTKIVYDKDDNIIEEHSYDYNGSVSQARGHGKKKSSIQTRSVEYPPGYYRNWMGKIVKMRNYESIVGPEHLSHRAPETKSSSGYRNDPTTMLPQLSDGGVHDNLLHNFVTFNTIFTLSGLSEEELKTHAYLEQSFSPHDIIARTGGIVDAKFSEGKYDKQMDEIRTQVRETYRQGGVESVTTHDYNESVKILKMSHDIFFENVNILSTVGPNPERGLANFTKMEFQLHEPFGVTLIEKIRAAAFTNGYYDYQDAPLLLTIEWKGWDEKGVDKKIPGNGLVRKIPILITRIQFDVDQGGAKYECVAVPHGDLAFDDRFKFPRTNIDITCNNIKSTGGPRDHSGWIEQMKLALEKQMDDEIEEEVRELADEYDFVVHPDIIKTGKTYFKKLQTIHAESNASVFDKISKFFTGSGTGPVIDIDLKATAGSVDLKTALPKFFEDAIRTLVGYQELVERFWYTWGSSQLKNHKDQTGDDTTKREVVLEYLQDKDGRFSQDLEKNQYVDWFMIKPKVETPNPKRIDRIRKVSPKKITYMALPMKIHILKFIKPGVSFGNINWDKYIRKNYDYIYTGNNLDVQNLRIDYKTAYWMRNVRPLQKTKTAVGEHERLEQKFETVIRKVFGAESYPPPEPRAPLRQEVSVIQGRSTMSSSDPRQYKNQEFYDYLTNPQADMMRIELKILGDPAYICQDIYTPLREDNLINYKGSWDSSYNSFNAEQYQPLIKVNYRLPDESNEKLGVMFEKQLSLREVLFFNGIYQVTKVESSFDSGQFTQILHCVRLNNQQGKGVGARISAGDKAALFPPKKRDARQNYYWPSQSIHGGIMDMQNLEDDITKEYKKRQEEIKNKRESKKKKEGLDV